MKLAVLVLCDRPEESDRILQGITYLLPSKVALVRAFDEKSGSIILDEIPVNVNEWPISIRTKHAPHRRNLDNLDYLCDRTREELLEISQIGERSVEEISNLLAFFGLNLKPSE